MAFKYSRASANTADLLRDCVGEKVDGVILQDDGVVLLVFSSGCALAFSGHCQHDDEVYVSASPVKSPAFWKLCADDVNRVRDARKQQIEEKLAQLRAMGA